ncbi:hypothetical protein [Mycobacteroides abscessus]|uniref:hypothetical protein n=1 Tax=Mycobacteroides abscessus TaxID=36809 RepID=UPI001F39A3BD|nr:hypothetical protein [Mycobacteroides abscessus]
MTTKEPSDPDLERGLYAKYRVEKVNGKPVGECFVLEAHDRHAIEALRAYAQSCVNDYPSLSTDLIAMAGRWEDGQICSRIETTKCGPCGRERTLRDAYDYNPLQVISGQALGWYSGEDGEICPECMTALIGRANR